MQLQIGKLHHDINVLQLHPIIRIKDTIIQVRDNLVERRTIAKEIENHYSSIYGEPWGGNGIRYIMISIFFEDHGIIPAVQCELSNIEWNIADKTYKIAFNKRKQKINIWNTDVVKILVEESDILTDEDAFFNAVDIHEHYVCNGTWGYEKSIITLNMKYINHINQKEYNQLYELTCQVISSAEGLKVESNFLKFLESGNG